MMNDDNSGQIEKQPLTLISDEAAAKLLDGFNQFTAAGSERERLSTEAMLKLNERKFDTIHRLSRDEKIFKVIILVLTVGTLIYVATIDKMLGVAPVLGFIIGSVLNGDAVGSFIRRFQRERVGDDDV
jgi:hypothetical protein